MADAQVALVLLGVFWAGTAAVFTGIKNTQEVRDRIILGRIGESQISTDYLWRILFLDWLPLKLARAFMALVLAIIILMLPDVGPNAHLVTICRVAAAFPLLGFSFEVISFVLELRFLIRQIRSRQG